MTDNYAKFYRLPIYIQREMRSRYTQPFSLEAIEYGESLLEEQVEEDIQTVKNYFKGD